MFYTIYKITNQIDGKFYIGSHKTKNLNDNYMGSGKYLLAAQKRYGIENFTKEILYVFDTPEQMYAKEAELVNEEFLSLENTYNLKVGGFGGWDYINENVELRKEKNKKARKNSDKKIFEKYGVDNSAKTEISRKKLSESIQKRMKKGFKPVPPSFKGKKHSLETKKILSEKSSLSQKGNKNSQFDTVWITDGKNTRKVKKAEDIPYGWKKGRTLLRA